jgi:hypothetical protein
MSGGVGLSTGSWEAHAAANTNGAQALLGHLGICRIWQLVFGFATRDLTPYDAQISARSPLLSERRNGDERRQSSLLDQNHSLGGGM